MDDEKPNLARLDGRPEGYVVPRIPGQLYECTVCKANGRPGARHKSRDTLMFSAEAMISEQAEFVCRDHWPEDTVIFNPLTGQCSDRQGNEWDGTKADGLVNKGMIQ